MTYGETMTNMCVIGWKRVNAVHLGYMVRQAIFRQVDSCIGLVFPWIYCQ